MRTRNKPKGKKRPRAWHRTCTKPLWVIAMQVRRYERERRRRQEEEKRAG